jgi:hypothetical protein
LLCERRAGGAGAGGRHVAASCRARRPAKALRRTRGRRCGAYARPVSVWRRKALESFPELARELTADDVDSTYAMWRDVFLPLTNDAYQREDADLLARIFDYAAWSARCPAKQVWNAVAVSFYEHLFDVARTPRWIDCVAKLTPRDVINDVWMLWEDQLSEGELRRLRG